MKINEFTGEEIKVRSNEEIDIRDTMSFPSTENTTFMEPRDWRTSVAHQEAFSVISEKI